MKPSIIDPCRAYLLVASLAAVASQTVILLSMLVLDVPEDVFTSPLSRVCVVAVIAATVLVVRRLAREAFCDALATRHARLIGWQQRTVALSAQCPRRPLVVLHVRWNRQRLEPALY
jgi:hypothetical protein